MTELKNIVEAALFITGRPLRASELKELLKASEEDILKTFSELSAEYASRDSAVEVVFEKNKAIMRIKPELEDAVMFLAPETEMSQAMLKTLAVIAHDEPVTQSKLVKTRGTRVYYYVKKLSDMELVSARKQGRTKILATTNKFKEYFRVDKIPKMAQEVAQQEVKQ
jgi:segregation and condensation protein B